MYRQLTEPEFVDFRVNRLQSDTADRECKELAFAEIVNEFSVPLRSFVKRMLGNNNPMACDAAEDIVQEVFLQAWGSMDRLKIEHKNALSAWLYTIARNTTLNKIRDNKKHETEYFMDGNSEAAGVAVMNSDIANPQKVLDFHSTIKELDAIPATQRRALFLTAWGGYSYEEVKNSENTVSGKATKAKVRRARVSARVLMRESPLLYS